MNYVYLNNFRGFHKALIPVTQCLFLVGENSTGKSSFLKLVCMLSDPAFWFHPEKALAMGGNFSVFNDVAMSGGTDSGEFTIGVVYSHSNKETHKTTNGFNIIRFKNKLGMSAISQFWSLDNDRLLVLDFNKPKIRYRINNLPKLVASEDPMAFLSKLLEDLHLNKEPFESPKRKLGSDAPLGFAYPFIKSTLTGKVPASPEFEFRLPLGKQLSYIAPVRSKPQRFYDSLTREFSPEGDHTPFMLGQIIRSRRLGEIIKSDMSRFGQDSGLFSGIEVHELGRSATCPLELLIRQHAGKFNIKNVGYGVSQVLPLVVEMLASSEGLSIAIEQPEVHLHPRAQAAFGSLLYMLACKNNTRFIVETHSDYIVDRFRLDLCNGRDKPNVSTMFFDHREDENRITVMPVLGNGKYAVEVPDGFRAFFVNEAISLLEI